MSHPLFAYTGSRIKELWSGQIPFSSLNEIQVTMMLYRKELPDFSALLPERTDFKACKERVFSICSLCWILDPENRPSMKTIAALMKYVISSTFYTSELLIQVYQRAFASEEVYDGHMTTDDDGAERSAFANDSVLDMTESPDNLSVVNSPQNHRNSGSLADNGTRTHLPSNQTNY